MNELPESVASIALAYYGIESGWVELPDESGIIAELGKISAAVDHFTTFAVLATVSPAAFELNNLSITASPSWQLLALAKRTGGTVTITFDVMNYGGRKGTYFAVLTVNGVTQETKLISLDPEKTQNVVFTLAGNESGDYQVEIGGLNGEFTSQLWINWPLILGLLAGLVSLGWLTRYLLKSR